MTRGGRRQPGPFAARPATTGARTGCLEPDLRLAAAHPQPGVPLRTEEIDPSGIGRRVCVTHPPPSSTSEGDHG